MLALETHALLVPEAVDLVPRRRLPRQPQRNVDPGAVVDRTPVRIRLVGPGVGIAVVLVFVHARDVSARPLVLGRKIEPESIAEDRTAEGAVDVPGLDEFVRI